MRGGIPMYYVCENDLELATDDSAGYDLKAVSTNVIGSMKRVLIKTGLKMVIPANCVGMICPRSGMALKKGLTVLNAPGIIDADYRGDVGIILINLSDEDQVIKEGDRVAQLVVLALAPVSPFKIAEEEMLSNSNRGEGGFGSTGT